MATKKLWKKIIAVALAVLLAFSSVPVSYTVDTYAATATKLYLKPNSNWLTDGAWFAAYFFGNGDTWVKMTDTDDDGYYECDVPAGYPSVIFCRMNPASTAMNWDNKWNQSADLSVPTDGTNCYTVANGTWDAGGGSWSTKIFGYYVAGSSGLCGENWDPTADPMTANSNGTYSITFSNVAAGTHTFKVVANGDYSAGSWPSSDYSLNVTTASDVTITFNPSNNNISVTQTPLTCSHSYTSKVTTAATCTTDGVRTYTCSKCGDTYTEVITASGHNMVNGTCSVCGYSSITTYTVTFNGSGVTSTGASTASSGSNYTATLKASSGYTLPTSITVKRGSTTLTSGTHYTYNSSTGALTISSSAITGNITITATGVAASEPDTGSGSYVLVDSLADITSGGQFVIVANYNGTNYALGTSVSSNYISGTSVTVSNNIVTSANPPVWTITPVSGNTVTISANGSYLRARGSSYTYLQMNTTSQSWTVAQGTSGFTFTNASYTTRALIFANSYTRFGAYSTSSSTSTYTTNLKLYKYQEAGSGDTGEDYYTVVGTQSLTGSNWDTTDTDNLMTQNADGTYSITYNNVAAGNYEIKAVKNGSYDEGQWPYSGNKAFTVSKTSNVTVTLNLTTNELTVTVEPVVNSYNVTFNGTNVTSNGASTANDAENYTATLTPATGYHLPAAITVKRGSTTLTSGTHYTYNSSTGALTINASAISGDITITAAAEQDYYIVVGTQSLTGSNWDTTDTDNLMTQNADGTYSITYNNVAAGNYEVKAVKNGSYDAGQWPYSGNKSFTVDETSKVTVTLNLTTNELTVDVVSLVSHYEVTFNGTNVTSNGSTEADDEHNYTATLTAAAGYKLPSAITVKVGGSTLSSSYYTYNSSTGALSIPASRITGDITITAVAEESVYMVVGSTGLTGSNWDTTDTDNLMTKNADGTYTIVYSAVPAGTHEFKITENGAWKWPVNNYVLNLDSTSKVTITYNPTTGEGNVTVESVYVRTDEIDLPADKVYYATVDLVDYLNNSRVENDQVKGYFTDNQGEWLNEDHAIFSYMNHLVSQQVAEYNHYTYPLYFGPLHFVKSRYSKEVGSTEKENLGNWSTAANVAFGIKDDADNINGSGVAQGLVKNTLDANGNLVDPSTNTPLLYFNPVAAEEWTNNGHKVMAYYPNLQFPFVMSYDEDNRVTTYSYDSAKDYAVYYDYTNPQLYASNTHVKDYKGNSGFYPLNAPTDADNQVNNGFGAKFTIDFTVGEDGYLANGEPVTFEFTGDDDVWVFIDGVLVLDMGGAHAMANGKIDFATRKATVSNATSVLGSYKITSGTTYQQSTYSGKNLENYIYDGYNDGIDVMERATPDTGNVSATFKELGLDFDYGSVHTMTVFYMERGMFESNFSMEFTMVPVPSGLTLSKNLNDTEINKGLLDAISRADDLSFTLEATSPDENTSVAFSQYTLLDKYTGYSLVKNITCTQSDRTYTATINGINNYVYAHSFFTTNGEDAFIPGTSFKITETTKGLFTYTGTTWAIYDANNGYQTVKTSPADTSSEIAEFTMGTKESATAYSYAVSFTNKMALGNLQVVKNVSDASLNGVDFTFKVYIDLDGSRPDFSSSLYPGLVYTIDGTTYTSTDGTIIVPGGKTAVISGLPAGATYRVEEVVPSGVNWILSSSSGTTGTIEADNTQIATFTNAMEVGTLQISKVFNSNWLSDTQFTFTVRIDNSLYSGSYTIGGTTYTTTNGTITLSGGQTAVISGLPAGATYTVSETVPTNAAWELSSSTGTTDTIIANDTKTASFTNTLKTGDLQISKAFNSSWLSDTQFTFTVYVDADGSGTAYSSLYSGYYTVGGRTYSTTNGTITLSGGQTAVISGLPAGASYTVSETVPTNAAWELSSSTGTTGTITANGTKTASFTNTLKTGNLQIFKVFNSSWLSDTQFTFTVYVDADGSGSAYSSSLYSGYYTVGGRTYSTTNGTVTLSGGQTAVISGLPAGASYTVSETVPTNAAWELSSSTGTTGTITANGTKAASFTNTLKTGDLQISKVFNDTVLGDTQFTFTVYVDADGSGTAYSSSLYSGYYTIGTRTYSTTNGTVTLSGGQTAVISGLPAGATYRVVEVIPEDAPWKQVSKSGDSGSITANGTASARFTNAVKAIGEHNKKIYVEAGAATKYTIKYNGQIVDITDLTPVTGLTATDNGDHIKVTGQDPDQQYTLTYEGRLEDGTMIGGSITVYTFQAMKKVDVFDFGLSSNLADTTYGYGLFQQDYLFNQHADGESAALYAITRNEDTSNEDTSNEDTSIKDKPQTAITYTQGAAIEEGGESSEVVTFRPTAFMSKVETYSYTVHITASGETFEAGNPETGCAVTGTIMVMPANSVYYEDNFNVGGSDASEKFIYSNSQKAPTSAPERSQSNDQSSNYGYDDAYLGDYADSNNSATELGHEEYTYFTFTGTGFDLDSRTTAGTAGMAVYVFKDTHRQAYLDYVTDLKYKGTLPSQPVDMVFVNNYYANGDLYQVPVVSVRLDECATYTVYIQCLSTYYASSVIIDGVRIYNPLNDTSKYLLNNEKNTSREELRVMYKDGLVSHAIKNGDSVASGFGKGYSIVEQITGGKYTTAQKLMDIYKSGPNNEMYLPANCGIGFSYTVTDTNWTLQLGAKAVTASEKPENQTKTISVWVRSGYDRYTKVDTIELNTTTDMYYDLTGALADYCEIGTSYDIIIISEEAEDKNNEFVSLTTVKYAGVTLGSIE